MRIFVAGAGGVIGRRLVPLLVANRHQVTGTTRSPDRAVAIRSAGADAVIVNVFDAARLAEAVARAGPEVVIHQLTDLARPSGVPLAAAALVANARLRKVGTANLVAASVAAGARRIVAQSIAWLYAPGLEPHDEEDPLLPMESSSGATLRGVIALERLVGSDPRFDGVILRYGRLYGPGTWTDTPADPPTVHVDAAALAAALAIDHGVPGIYNIVDHGGPVSNKRAVDALGWSPGRRIG